MSPSSSPPPAIEAASECWAAADGYRMRYLRAGRGRPLLLLHGLLGYSFSWRFNLGEFARFGTVYAVDLPGVGFSDRPVLDCSLGAIARRLAEFLDRTGVGEFDLLGTSHGGAVAMTLAALDPRRVRRMVLSAPANPWSRSGRVLVRIFSSAPGRFLAPRVVRIPALHRSRLRRMYGDASRIPPGTLEGYSAAITIPGTIEHVLRIVRRWNSDLDQLRRTIPAIAGVPTLLLWGTRDTLVLPTSAASLQAQFRRAELVLFDGAGHLPYEELPQAFNRAVLDFLAS